LCNRDGFDTHESPHLADVIEVAMCRLPHSRHFIELVEQFMRVVLVRQKRQSAETEGFPDSIITRQ